MDAPAWLSILNYGLVLIYGLLLSTHIAGGWQNRTQKHLIIALCPILLLLQCLCWLFLGIDVTRQLYPLIVHLPLACVLICALKKEIGVSIVSVCTAYLCCQIPKWLSLAVTTITTSPFMGELSYFLAIFPIYILLRRYFAPIAHDAIIYSRQNLLLFGSLPLAYYVFDYTTVIYSDALYAGIPVLTEFFPTALILFYVAFLTAYHAQTQKRAQAELQRSMLEVELKQAGTELENLRNTERQTAVYRHNMRHHLTAINAFLSAGESQQAVDYIQKVQEDITAITPKRFCENELVNLLCSSFCSKAETAAIHLSVNARLPRQLPLSDTELCSLLSNGLENALHAVSDLSKQQRWVELYCDVRHSKLLIEIRNPYAGQITLHDQLPLSQRPDHGYGCRSIRAITEQKQGLCSFDAQGNIFTLRVAIPAGNLY